MKRRTFFDDPAHAYTDPWGWRVTVKDGAPTPPETTEAVVPVPEEMFQKDWDQAKIDQVGVMPRDGCKVH